MTSSADARQWCDENDLSDAAAGEATDAPTLTDAQTKAVRRIFRNADGSAPAKKDAPAKTSRPAKTESHVERTR